MSAEEANDRSGVEYFFDERTGHVGGSDSGWQASPHWTDEGLQHQTVYRFRVRVRDLSAARNLTAWSREIRVETPPPNRRPVVSAGGPYEVDEGGIVLLSPEASDPDNDDLTWAWDLDDDGRYDDSAEPNPRLPAPDGDHTVRVSVRVSDGEFQAEDSTTVTVRNVAPRVTNDPAATAQAEEEWTYVVAVEEPGDDEVTLNLTRHPEGMSLVDHTVRWTPTLQQLGGHEARLIASDEDGGESERSWLVTVGFMDEDGDGLPDVCERRHGFDVGGQEDPAADPDADGRGTLDECLAGTDPTFYDGPPAPVVASPKDGARVADVQPPLVVDPGLADPGGTFTCLFELFAGEAPAAEEPVGSGEGNTGESGTASWEIDMELAENHRYWWRARTSDGFIDGPWSDSAVFLVDVENEPPTVPNPVAPAGSTDSQTPQLVADPSTDPEGDAIRYIFEVRAEGGAGADGETDEPAWTVPEPLAEDERYSWRLWAEDALGATSDTSEDLAFRVNTDNRLPAAPVLDAPGDGALVTETPVVIRWQPVFDPDGDEVTYEVEVATDGGFSNVLLHKEDLVGDGSGGSIEVPEAQEDAIHHVRVRATDPHGAGPYSTGVFRLNAQNVRPDVPGHEAPEDGAVVEPGEVTLEFRTVVDQDGDAVRYRVKVVAEAGRNTGPQRVEVPPSEDETTHAVVELTEQGTYNWTVVAVDELDAEASSGSRSLEVRRPGAEPPTSSGGLCQTGGGGHGAGSVGFLGLAFALLAWFGYRRSR